MTEGRVQSLKRLGRGRYLTADGRYLIESDCPSVGESYDLQGFLVADEQPRPSEWFIYDATNARVQRDDYGPPDALADGFDTLRQAKAYAESLTTPAREQSP